MKKIKFIVFRRKTLYFLCSIVLVFLLSSAALWIYLSSLHVNMSADPKSAIIVIDPGHGGIDGGTNKDGILEKEINLAVSKKLKVFLEEKGYRVVMTREEDVSLDSLDFSSHSRHQRDLSARVNIINNSNAQLFLSIHVNCNFNRPATDGAIVFYNDNFAENKVLAYSVQRALNAMEVNGVKRSVHNPVQAQYYLLSYSKIPGVIVETAFMSNGTERYLLTRDEFREQLAKAIADGTERYLKGSGEVFSPLPGEGGKLAIIIDDFGAGRNGVKEMMSINRNLTFAVMPFSEYSREDAEAAHENGYEVIVHLPMEPNQGKRSWLGPRPILAGMKGDEVRQIVRDAFEDVPFAAGANIHMGSKASSDESIISAVLDIIKEKELYFVDSRTADHPIGKKVADVMGVRCYERNIFMDGQQPKSFVKSRLAEAADVSVKKGYAVAIGHVGIEGGKITAEAIREMLPEFDRKNVELVYVSELDR